MSAVCIIPARWGSTRFPGKPLAPIRGGSGEALPLIVRTIEQAISASCFNDIYVATDDKRIKDVVDSSGLGVEAIMTSPDLRNGTERCAEAAKLLGLTSNDIVVNLQGDSVLMPRHWIATLVHEMRSSHMNVATCVYERTADYVPAPGDVQALLAVDYSALYFTRGPIPQSPHGRFQHFGIYAYRCNALYEYTRWEPTPREEAESLEQLRFLEHGWPIKCIHPLSGITPEREVNYPDDVAAVEEVLRKWNIE